MSYISLPFLGFTAACLLLYWLLPKPCRPYVLLAASLCFYVLSAKWLLLPVVLLTAILYGGSLWMGKKDAAFAAVRKELGKEERKAAKQTLKHQKKKILALECLAAFGMLVGFKYTGFLAQTVNGVLSLFSAPSIPVPAFLLPLGISYYTLSMISYAADVYYGKIEPEKNPLRLLLFAAYFPHVVEGPIARYKPFAARVCDPEPLDFDRFLRAGECILLGLMKKMILADRAGMIADVVFTSPGDYRFAASAGAVFLYTIQIYMDFSGCIDLVRGVSALFGIPLADNFRRPFFSRSVQEFWRRWHITLGAWIKDYIFYPLSLSGWNTRLTGKAGKIHNACFRATLPMLLPLLFVWLFTGIWHGASWKYVLYGFYYYVLLALGLLLEPVFAKVCGRLRIDRESRAYHAFQILRTDVLVMIGLTLFRADTVRQAGSILLSVLRVNADIKGQLLTLKDASTLSFLDFALLGVGILLFMLLSCREEKGFDLYAFLEKHPVRRWIFCTVAILALIALGVWGSAYTAKPFVYAQF